MSINIHVLFLCRFYRKLFLNLRQNCTVLSTGESIAEKAIKKVTRVQSWKLRVVTGNVHPVE